MIDGFGNVQSIVVLGGSSDIAGAVLARLAVRGRVRTLVLAVRDPERIALGANVTKAETGPRVEFVRFDALDTDAADTVVGHCFDAAGEPVDLVLLAVGELGHPDSDEADPVRVVSMMNVNATWPAAALTAVASRLRRQGYGRVVVLSSVAGTRVRRANFVYGSGKAALDGFALGLAESLRGTQVLVQIVRPGFVRTKMTMGLAPAPFAVSPDRVARDIERGLADGRSVIWSPSVMRWIVGVFRMLPAQVWRRIPG